MDGITVQHTKDSLKMVSTNLSANSEIQLGDKAYIFDADDCPSEMSLKDSILDSNSVIHALKDITPVYGIVVSVTIEGSD
jgi:hypothetical protein